MNERQRQKKILQTNVPIETETEGITLRGRVVYGNRPRELFRVILEHPKNRKGKYICFGHFGYAMICFHAFSPTGELTERALQRAKHFLIEIYRYDRFRDANPYRFAPEDQRYD